MGYQMQWQTSRMNRYGVTSSKFANMYINPQQWSRKARIIKLYIKLIRSGDCFFYFVFRELSFVFVTQSLYADKRIVNNYIESVHRKEQLATRMHTTPLNVDFIHVYFCEATDSMQYRSPNEYQACSSEHKPLRLRFCQSRPTCSRESMYAWLVKI